MSGAIEQQLQQRFPELRHSLPDMSMAPALGRRRKSSSPSRQSRCNETMDAIKAYILREGLQPGDPLPTEQELTEKLGASRSSVREAVRKLEALHIVQVIHGRGTFVGDLSLEPLIETLTFRALTAPSTNFETLYAVIEVRRFIDIGTAEMVVAALKHASAEDLSELNDLVEKMCTRAAAGEDFFEDDITFHTCLLSQIGNEALTQVGRSLCLVHMSVLPRLGLHISAELAETAVSHRAILEAAQDGDVEEYRRAITSHYEPVEAIVREKLGYVRAYF